MPDRDPKSPPKIVLTPVDGNPKQFTMALTEGKTATIQRLNGFETLVADDYAADTVSGMRASRTYGICMLRKLDDQEVLPLSDSVQFQVLAQKLTSQDTVLLARAFNQLENPEEGVALKNGQSGDIE